MRKSRKLLSVLLAGLMMVGGVMSVSAAQSASSGTYSITIENHEGLPDLVEDQFRAYQIFKGDLTSGSPDNRELANIQWGDGIQGPQFAAALVASEDPLISAKFSGKSNLTAADVALVIGGENSEINALGAQRGGFMQAFANLAKDYLTEEYTSNIIVGKNAVIYNDVAGYYMLTEDESKLPNRDGKDIVFSEFILDVLGNQTVTLKGDIPTVTKKIVSKGADVDGVSAGIGEIVQFKLTGTLPDNFDTSYASYSYKFNDVMGDGLDYFTDGTHLSVMKVYKNAEDASPVTLQPTVESDTNYELDTETAHQVTVTMDDLKKLNGATVTKDSVIEFTYYAKVNTAAAITETNKVTVTYSNNPNDATKTGETVADTVNVYNYGLDITKLASDVHASLEGSATSALQGAGFILSRNKGTEEFATFDGSGKLTGWVTSKGSATTVKSNASGKLAMTGLDIGTYTLTEVETPAGYSTMNPIEFTVAAVIAGDGSLTSVSLTVAGSRPDAGVIQNVGGSNQMQATSAGSTVDHTIPMTLINQRATTLPHTGGIGTVIFYTLGAIMVLGSAAYLIFARKKQKAE